MYRTAIIMPLALLLGVSSVMAFDGKREGFVIGGGLGFAPSIKSDDGVLKTDSPGGGVNLLIGFAWDDQNMIAWEANMVSYERGGADALQGTSTITWYHYFKPTGQSCFVAGGLGLYHYARNERWGWWWITEHDKKAGYLLGGGYQFRPHWQLGLYVSFGKTEYQSVTYEHSAVSLLINGIAF